MSDRASYIAVLAGRRLVNYYQPIVDLQSGQVLGVEVLVRMADSAGLHSPAAFLPLLDPQGLLDLLFASLDQALHTLLACDATHPKLFFSINASPRVLLREGFQERLLSALAGARVAPERLTLEILESDEFLSLPAARVGIDALHACGIRIALDDVGAGYSSLSRLRELPVDKIKLDQDFVRELHHKPEGLHFVFAMLSLARGLHNLLIVEGVETPEILAALGVMGIEGAQGYAIARPMPHDVLLAWLEGHVPVRASPQPTSLLGAYASHLLIVEACRGLMTQPLKFTWSPEVRDPHGCPIGRYFDANGLHDMPYGLAHKRFHAVIDQYSADPAAWEDASQALWRALQSAIKAPSLVCERVEPAVP